MRLSHVLSPAWILFLQDPDPGIEVTSQCFLPPLPLLCLRDLTPQLARGSLGGISSTLSKWPCQAPPSRYHLSSLLLCISLLVPAAQATRTPWRLSRLHHDSPDMPATYGFNRDPWRKDCHPPPPHSCTWSHRAAVLPGSLILDSELGWWLQTPFQGTGADGGFRCHPVPRTVGQREPWWGLVVAHCTRAQTAHLGGQLLWELAFPWSTAIMLPDTMTYLIVVCFLPESRGCFAGVASFIKP